MAPITLHAMHVHSMISFQTRRTLCKAVVNSEESIHELVYRTLLVDGEERRGEFGGVR